MKTFLSIFSFVWKLFSPIIVELLKTKAIKEKVDVQEGDAKPVPDSMHDGMYGMRDRSKDGEDVVDGESDSDTGSSAWSAADRHQ